MVDGFKDKELKVPLVVVDLDGTYISANTFKIFMSCGLCMLFLKKEIYTLAYVLWLLLLRKLRLLSHRTLKFKVFPLFSNDENLKDLFIRRVAPLVNQKVKRIIDSYRASGCRILLATAAADTYISWIWDGDYQGTCMTNNPDRLENRGEMKLSNVLKYVSDNNLKLQTVITDHSDDLPLLKQGAENILVKPSEKSTRIIINNNVPINKIID